MAVRKLDEIWQAVEKLTPSERSELVRLLSAQSKSKYPDVVVDLSPFYGTAKFQEDALQMQQRWRSERP